MLEEKNDINIGGTFETESKDVRIQAKLGHHTAILDGIVRFGRIVEPADDDPTDPGDTPRVLVQIGGDDKNSYIRNWMQWTTARAGIDGEWWAPETGEQVLVVAPSGNLTQGVIVGSLYRGFLAFDLNGGDITQAHALPGKDSTSDEGKREKEKQIHKRVYKDGSNFIYDRNEHRLSMTVKSSRQAAKEISATITADESMVITAGTTQITVNQDGAVDISAQDNDITIAGNVKVTGSLDVS